MLQTHSALCFTHTTECLILQTKKILNASYTPQGA